VEKEEISEFSDASDNMKEMPEMQEFLDNIETEVSSHYILLNKSETQSITTYSTVL
jgi:N-acetyl-anhydromuramyl-L-alanine amidase AmpD